MFTQIGLLLIFVSMVYLHTVNAVPVQSTDMDEAHQKRYSSSFFGIYGIDPNYLLPNRPFYDDDTDKNIMLYKKPQSKKKWTNLFQRSQSPYTIAFPALIRTRRWIEPEQ